jgi:hypothetical protein
MYSNYRTYRISWIQAAEFQLDSVEKKNDGLQYSKKPTFRYCMPSPTVPEDRLCPNTAFPPIFVILISRTSWPGNPQERHGIGM